MWIMDWIRSMRHSDELPHSEESRAEQRTWLAEEERKQLEETRERLERVERRLDDIQRRRTT
jgi:hypothetical protein